jgi:effector-binding domain-containing protein
MELAIARLHVAPLRIAACHDVATLPDLPWKIRRAVDSCITSLRASGTRFNRCVCVYWDHPGEEPLLLEPGGCEVDVGWEVEIPYADVETPAGTVATATLIGPYDDLPDAHRAIRRWCTEHGARRQGPYWEVYDHPREGEPPRVDVFYLLG